MTEENKEVEQAAKAMTEFVLQFDEETQEMWMRLFELFAKQELTEQDTEESKTLLSQLELASAEQSNDPMAKATLVPGEVAFQKAFEEAKQAGLSRLGVQIAGVTAKAKARGDTPSEAEKFVEEVFLGATSADGRGHLDSQDIGEAIDEVKGAGLWPWKGLN